MDISLNIPLDKTLFYDWIGFNKQLFLSINAVHSGYDYYDRVMILLSHMADAHKFPYYFIGLLAWTIITYLPRKLLTHGTVKLYLHMWIGVLAVLLVGFAAEALTVHLLKEQFSYPRPYLVFDAKDIRVLEYKFEVGNDHHSFPSGHAFFITLMVVGLWPALASIMRFLGVLLIVAVCWSRIAMGMHFPADVAAGVLLGLFMTLIVRMITYSLLHRFQIKC